MQKISFHNSKGLPLNLSGTPELPQDAAASPEHRRTDRVGLIGVGNFPGLRPRMQVAEGDRVLAGQPLFTDKNNPALVGAAPAAGRVAAIHRGHKRALIAVEIDRDGTDDAVQLQPLRKKNEESAAILRERLIASGLWSAFRERPYDRVPTADSQPAAILVTLTDSRPLSAPLGALIDRHAEAFIEGLRIIMHLTPGRVFICTDKDTEPPVPRGSSRITRVVVSGCYPATLPGTLMHHIYPPAQDRRVWYVDWQDLVHMADLVCRGTFPSKRYLALSGGFAQPRLITTSPGADLQQLATGQLEQPEDTERGWRLVSGSPLYGHRAADAMRWLGRYDSQCCAIPEGGEPVFMNWLRPGFQRYSRMPVFVSRWLTPERFIFNTLRNGGERGMVPVEVYEDAMPLQTPVVPLLKALLSQDTERAQALGCLELGEEDLALCTFICPSKYDYGAALRNSLDRIEREG